MKRADMDKKVADELAHVPRGIKGHPQSLLRAAYNMIRRHDLAVDPATPAKESLMKAVEAVRKDDPEVSPVYDKAFFERGD